MLTRRWGFANLGFGYNSGASILPLSFDFTGSNDTALSTLGFTAGAQWTIQSNAANCAPTLGSELVTNGGMEGVYDDESAGGGGTVNVAPNWSKLGVETDGTDTLDESATAHGGSKSQQINVDAANEGIASDASFLASGSWYLLTSWLYGTSGNVQLIDGAGQFLSEVVTPAVGSWTRYTFIIYATSSRQLLVRSSGGAANFLIDDVSNKEATFSDLIATIDGGQANVVNYADLTIADGAPCGLICNLDDTTTPANYLFAYHDGIKARLLKVVGGTVTSLISVAAAYGAGNTLKVTTTKSGSDLLVDLEYDGSPVGTQQTVSDAGIVSNTIHGLFNTYSGNSIDNWNLEAN